MKNILIKTEYITLGQFLKYVGLIDSGSSAKFFLQEENVQVNGINEARRGRKLYDKDVVRVFDEDYIIGK